MDNIGKDEWGAVIDKGLRYLTFRGPDSSTVARLTQEKSIKSLSPLGINNFYPPSGVVSVHNLAIFCALVASIHVVLLSSCVHYFSC